MMASVQKAAVPAYRRLIGNREIVGPSCTPKIDSYYDRVDQPCPPIRFKEPTAEIKALSEKEKGSWKALTIDEKKRLYRYSFCQTFSEMEAPNCHGRRIFGACMMMLSIPIAIFAILKLTIYPPLPESMSDEGKKRLVRWYIDARADPMDGGISGKWDYEKQQWKEKPYMFMRSN